MDVSLLTCMRSLAVSGRTVVKGAEVGQGETVSGDRRELHEPVAAAMRETPERRTDTLAGPRARPPFITMAAAASQPDHPSFAQGR